MMDRTGYDAQKFSDYLMGLCNARGVTMRAASLGSGLDHGAVGRFVRGRRPHRDSCLILAEFFGVDPNQVLQMAAYEAMPVVDRSLINPAEFPPDVKELAEALSRFDSTRRREIIEGLRLLLQLG